MTIMHFMELPLAYRMGWCQLIGAIGGRQSRLVVVDTKLFPDSNTIGSATRIDSKTHGAEYRSMAPRRLESG